MIWSRRRSVRAAGDLTGADGAAGGSAGVAGVAGAGNAGGPLPRMWATPVGRLARAAAAAVLVAVAVAWWVHGDGGSPAGPAAPAGAASRPAAAQDLGQLASAVGCPLRLTGQNSGYRQAVCVTPAGRYTLTTFSTDRGQQEWLSEALPYGGAYLVGTRWVVNASTSDGLPAVAAKLGGTIVDKTQDHHS